jgi:sugar lactone lactonase YvrE
MGTDGTVTVIEKELHRPNGVALSPDERTLYVSQSEPTRAIIMAYTLDADGNVGQGFFTTHRSGGWTPGAARRVASRLTARFSRPAPAA